MTECHCHQAATNPANNNVWRRRADLASLPVAGYVVFLEKSDRQSILFSEINKT